MSVPCHDCVVDIDGEVCVTHQTEDHLMTYCTHARTMMSQRGSVVRLLLGRYCLVFLVFGWSCSKYIFQNGIDIANAMVSDQWFSISHVGQRADINLNGLLHSGSCPGEELLQVFESKNNCLSENLCRENKHIVHWRKRQCLDKCPPRYIAVDFYCSLRETCSSRRITNLSMLVSLRNCTVIEGSLEIVLIESVTVEDWKNISFPDLLEITDFLLLNKVKGLTSLGQLFPNLAVIRGMRLFEQYSLVIYDTHLQDIGLHSLISILRGSVRIQNNFSLCYVHTINWTLITNTSSSDNVLTNNNESLCKNCCPSCSPVEGSKESCQYCWNSAMNQHTCGSDCVYGCTTDKKCCHEECVGGCQASNNDRACHACRHFTTGDRCVRKCPKGYLQYKDYRCVTKEYCNGDLAQFNGTHCLEKCPDGYRKTNSEREKNICKKCQNCDKPCVGMLVNSVGGAQDLKGCKTINGSLIISIRYGKTVTKELEASLGSIERVTHYVRIFKTGTLKSLNFLQSLQVIDGENLYRNEFALFVHENANLEDIWDFSKGRKLNITRGKISFLANPKLCYKDKIERLLTMTGHEEDFSMKFTNGDKVACSIMKHNIHLEPLEYKGMVLVKWQSVYMDDDRMITGYYIYYKETNNTDSNAMESQDACDDKWEKKHEEVSHSGKTIRVMVKGLKPSSSYAIYVETDTVADDDIGVRSKISYVDTLPYNPSPPQKLRIESKGDAHIALTWSPPSFPNGQVEDYVVQWTLLQEEEEKVCVDHCSTKELQSDLSYSEGKSISKERHTILPTAASSSDPDSGGGDGGDGDGDGRPSECCSCPQEETTQVKEDYFDFETRLNNYTYIYRPIRFRRSLHDTRVSKSKSSLDAFKQHYTYYQRNTSSPENGILRNKSTYINITGLSHYSKYVIKVSACHKINPQKDAQLCSNWSDAIIGETTRKDNANLVSNIKFEEITESSVKVVWSAPNSPNGHVLAYKVLLSTHFQNSKRNLKDQQCLSPCMWNGTQDSYFSVFRNLTPGTKYYVYIEAHTRDRVRPTSDQMNGNATPSFTTPAEDRNSNGKLLVIIGILVILAIMCGIFVFRRVRPHKLPVDKDRESCIRNSIKEDGIASDCVYSVIPRKNVIDSNNLRLLGMVGEGTFGRVYKGRLQLDNKWVTVAVKKPTNYISQEEMLAEAKLMFHLDSYHIVHAYGVSIIDTHTFLVMEFMSGGDLHKYLQNLQESLRIEQVCDMALQIADGMAYLASKNYVHRDLAARNCLLNGEMKIKISDFGMTRIIENNYYCVSHHQLFPVRWLAPECFNSKRFRTQSDVWSYGIVLWEILTNGKKPYEEMKTNEEVQRRVRGGHTLKSSVRRLTEEWLADLISKCWEFEGNNRPSFPDIITKLLPHSSPDFIQEFRYMSYYHQSRGQQ